MSRYEEAKKNLRTIWRRHRSGNGKTFQALRQRTLLARG